jgi:molybdenum-dependent DNA-binding transcriptional regulator ModE
MFGWLKSDPIEKLDKQYQAKLKEAMETQRNGNIQRYAELTQEAESILESIDALKAEVQKI